MTKHWMKKAWRDENCIEQEIETARQNARRAAIRLAVVAEDLLTDDQLTELEVQLYHSIDRIRAERTARIKARRGAA